MTAEELKKMYPEQFEKIPTEMLNPQQQPQPQQPTNLANLMAIADQVIAIPGVRDLIIEYADDIDDLISEHAGNYKNIAYGYVKLKYPDIHKALTSNPDTPRNSQDASGREISEERDYIPDETIEDEIRRYAVTKYLAGTRWQEISDLIYQKYDVDWHYMKVKDIVLKSLAWREHETILKPVQNNENSKEITKLLSENANLKLQMANSMSNLKMIGFAGLVGIIAFVAGKII